MEEPSDRVCHTKLLLWYYEDQLKARYAKYLSIVKVQRRGVLYTHDKILERSGGGILALAFVYEL